MSPSWESRRPHLVLAALLVFHLVLISIQVPRGEDKTLFEKAIFFVFSPLQKGAVAAFRGLSSAWKGYFDLRGVRTENRRLKADLFFARQERWFLEDRLKVLESESRLRESLDRFRDSLIPARIVGIDAANLYSSVVVDKGLLHGVQIDMAVCDSFGNLVGRTVDPIGLNEATVQLITDEKSSASVISDRDRVVGVLSGRSGELCVLHYILVTSPGGQEGEELATTGYDGIYPAGLRAGRIISARPVEGTVFKDIVVQPHFRFNALDTVALLPKIRESGAGDRR
jgi:rod shape-determining protein MreC